MASTISAQLNLNLPSLLYTPFNTLLEVTRPPRRKSSLSSHFHINSNPKLCSNRTVLTRVCGDGGESGPIDANPQQKASSVIPKLPFVFQVWFSLSTHCQCIVYIDWRSFSKQWFLDVYWGRAYVDGVSLWFFLLMMNDDSILEFWPRIYRFQFVFCFSFWFYQVRVSVERTKIKNKIGSLYQ